MTKRAKTSCQQLLLPKVQKMKNEEKSWIEEIYCSDEEYIMNTVNPMHS